VGDQEERLRALPAVDRVMGTLRDHPVPVAADAARRAVDRARARVLAGNSAPSLEAIVGEAQRLLDEHDRSLLRPVINATGVLLHTNLGRAPLGERQLAAVTRVAGGYSNLEYDLAQGRRGSRYSHARRLLCRLLGAESALVTNNNAAALLVVLASLCRGRSVIISRGELIEIGGEFRIPDVLAASGAHLVEVGTTNRTRVADYEAALDTEVAAILKVHPSNYRVVGFTSSVGSRALARLAHAHAAILVHDVGSGLLSTVEAPAALGAEPRVDVALADGADLVLLSADKLLGGPQAGIVAGRSDLVERVSRHPLARAVRPDKMALAALEATAETYLEGRAQDLPLWRMALAPLEEVRARAQRLAARLGGAPGTRGVEAEAVPARAVTGGGSLPGGDLPSWAVALGHESRSAASLEAALRRARVPVIARIENDVLLLDLRTVPPDQDELLESAVRDALGPSAGA
jgi:L-seryl-tRNA(Ser) seleniumtransferase